MSRAFLLFNPPVNSSTSRCVCMLFPSKTPVRRHSTENFKIDLFCRCVATMPKRPTKAPNQELTKKTKSELPSPVFYFLFCVFLFFVFCFTHVFGRLHDAGSAGGHALVLRRSGGVRVAHKANGRGTRTEAGAGIGQSSCGIETRKRGRTVLFLCFRCELGSTRAGRYMSPFCTRPSFF